MAFKLMGDQYSQIKQAKKRRVSKLLQGDIPENEIFKMRDGRIACMVCRSRPVFDAVTMLTIHRKGKKHLEAVHSQIKLSEKQNRTQSHTVQEEIPPLLLSTQSIIKSITSSDSNEISNEGVCLSSRKRTSGCTSVVAMETKISKIEESTVEMSSSINSNKTDDVTMRSSDLMSRHKYLQLRSSGWLPDYDGTWKKDPNVEFDSDEEEEKEEEEKK